MNNNWIVYRHISPSNKVYVGITCNKANYRWGPNGKNYLIKDNNKYRHPIFAQAILKYGWENFTHEIIIENISKSEADYAEKYLIRWYKLHSLSYNVTDGGEGVAGVEFSEERRASMSRKMREWHKNHVNPMLNRSHTDKAKEKIKENHRHYQSQETREKISKAQLGKAFPNWRKKLLSDAHAQERIPVIQLSLDNKFIAEYASIMDASRASGIHNSQIARAIKRKGSAKGFKWLNKNEYDY